MNQELESLTWKYFWEQKIKEVSKTLGIILLIIFIPYFLGHNIGDNKDINCGVDLEIIEDCSTGIQWLEGVSYILLTLMILITLSLLFYISYMTLKEWIESNWYKAKYRANNELRKSKAKVKG